MAKRKHTPQPPVTANVARGLMGRMTAAINASTDGATASIELGTAWKTRHALHTLSTIREDMDMAIRLLTVAPHDHLARDALVRRYANK